MSPLGDQHLTRRCLLRRTLQSGAGFVLMGSIPVLASCSHNDAPPRPRVEYERLLKGERVVIMDGEVPVELAHVDGEIHARSLICTHQGCVVSWDEQARRYLCPCHEGVFDADGNPLLGPPESPLHEFAVEHQAEFVYVLTNKVPEKP